MRPSHLLAAATLTLMLGCGGSTEDGSTSGGGTGATSGGGGSSAGGGSAGSSGSSGSGASAGTGGGGGSGAVGGVGGAPAGGGTGGCDPSSCGPDGAPCCSANLGCANAGPSGGLTCTCTSALVWSCTSGSGGAGGGTGGTGGGSPCTGTVGCAAGLSCCNGKCVNTANDPFNCGGCNNVCAASPQYCSGICGKPPCFGSGTPPPNTFCCGQTFCKVGQLCCDVNGPGPSAGPTCHTPTQAEPTCPVGCPLCQ